MASTQEIHHLPVQGQDFNIQGGHRLQPTKPPTFTHKPHKKCVACEPVWKHKPLKKWSKHKLNKDECSSSSSVSCLSTSSSNDSCLRSSSSSDSCLRFSSSSDSCLDSSSSSDSCLDSSSGFKPICKHKPRKESHLPVKCFESKHKLKKGKGHFVPGKKPNLECKFKPTKHCEEDVHKLFDCEDRFRRCLTCKQEFTCECLEHSHFGLCALRVFLTRRCDFFGCHRLWEKPWSKPGPDKCQTSHATKN